MSRVGGADLPGMPSAPRWTPPIPPVAKTSIPAAAAAIIVAETVVAAQPPPMSARERLGLDAFITPFAVARVTSCPSSRPTMIRPPRMAIVAGTAPLSANGELGRAGHLDALRVRQAVADERRLEGDDGTARGDGVGDLGGEREPVVQTGRCGMLVPCLHDADGTAPAGADLESESGGEREPGRGPRATAISRMRAPRGA